MKKVIKRVNVDMNIQQPTPEKKIENKEISNDFKGSTNFYIIFHIDFFFNIFRKWIN